MTEGSDERMLADLTREAVLLFAADTATLLVPVLATAVLFGLVQTIFSLQEASLGFLPKLAALVATLAVVGESLMRHLADLLNSGLIDMLGALR